MGIVIIGMGEMGGVFGRAFLRAGHPVIPVTRRSSTDSIASEYPDPELALVAVGEADLDQVLDGLPDAWRNKAGLLQNELLPSTWESRRVSDPTVIVVWFEKKAGRPVKVIQPSPVFGPATALVVDALATLEIPTTVPASAEEATLSLVAKNLYILVSNIAGLVTGGSVGELWDAHRELAMSVASDVLDVQEALIKSAVPTDSSVGIPSSGRIARRSRRPHFANSQPVSRAAGPSAFRSQRRRPSRWRSLLAQLTESISLLGTSSQEPAGNLGTLQQGRPRSQSVTRSTGRPTWR